ncbi:MAG: hypothetical protein NVS3B21_30060 [Acidimicrobiales bacterium]
MVRTEVGTKCETCARPVTLRVKRTTPWPDRRTVALIGAGGVLAVVAVLLLVTGRHAARRATPLLASLGSWAPAPSLSDIRGTAAVVRLPDGTVLAAGGGVGSLPLAAADIYDPGTRSWTPTAPLGHARRGAAVVLLKDGRALVAGGVAGADLLSSVEIYEPAAHRWVAAAPMAIPRLGATLTVLNNGDVLATGGTTTGGEGGTGGGQAISPTASAEIFRAATGAWTPTAPMGTTRFDASATALADGRVLVVGGFGGPGVRRSGDRPQLSPLRSAELYDPAVGTFNGAGVLGEGRAGHVAVRLDDGSILVAGGLGGLEGSVSLGSVERYDPQAGRWSQLTPMRQPRSGAAAVVLGGGRVLVEGGERVEQGARTSLSSAELFDPESASWRSAGNMSCPRSGQGVAALGDGSVVVVAGDTAFPGQAPVAQSCVDRYTPDPARR